MAQTFMVNIFVKRPATPAESSPCIWIGFVGMSSMHCMLGSLGAFDALWSWSQQELSGTGDPRSASCLQGHCSGLEEAGR